MIEDAVIANIVSPHVRWSRINSHHSRRRRARVRKSWAAFKDWLTERQFRRYFRMSKELFQQFIDDVSTAVGADEFKSEEYLQNIIDGSTSFPNPANNVSGKIKLAITMRILGGGSYLDCALYFEVSFNHAHKIFHEVINNWIRHPSFYPINGIEYCRNNDEMNAVALQFSQSSRGIICGCIGALDGWIVKVKKPSTRDGVKDPASFYSRKCFFGVNVQAIVDKKKRILYRSILSRGAEHDSTAFKNSSLYKWLIDNWNNLKEKGYYFIGDSAYGIRSFLHTPYDNAIHGTPEDNYNFFHSSSRISVECAFGEIDLRWGILWRPLQYSLERNVQIIDATMRLHNFIVDHRPGNEQSIDIIDRAIFDDDCRRVFHDSLSEEGVPTK